MWGAIWKFGAGVALCAGLAAGCGNVANGESEIGVQPTQNPCGGAAGTVSGSGGVPGAMEVGALMGPTGGAVQCNGNSGAGANTGAGAGPGPGTGTGAVPGAMPQ